MLNHIVENREVTYSIKPPFPRNMLIEPTNACNHNCIFCNNDKQMRKTTVIDTPLVYSLLEQAYEMGTREVGFYMTGEPLLCRDFSLFIKKAKDIGYEYIYLTTNGSKLDIKTAKLLIENGLNSLKYSINAATKVTYLKIHGKDDFDIVYKNVKDIHDFIEATDASIATFISYIICNENIHEKDLIFNVYGNLVDRIYLFEQDNRGGSLDGNMISSSGVYNVKENYHPCDMVFNRIHVTSSGFLTPCCTDENGMLSAVDLHTTSLNKAWYSDIMNDLRKQMIDKNLKNNQCYNCLYNRKKRIYPLNEHLHMQDLK